ncbi:oxidoreductase C-terminal domain-containing protein [Aeromicrobium sp. UC242_57]|uniref:oxidoreductase C-terminal domain-containing protein n=1 Tax=Aeromicrobium sp. UC242_57 TaxID=3374624 RepID=UPI0037887D3B
MEYVGRGSADDDVVIRGDRDSGEFVAYWLRDGVVTAAMNVNVWTSMTIFAPRSAPRWRTDLHADRAQRSVTIALSPPS